MVTMFSFTLSKRDPTRWAFSGPFFRPQSCYTNWQDEQRARRERDVTHGDRPDVVATSFRHSLCANLCVLMELGWPITFTY